MLIMLTLKEETTEVSGIHYTVTKWKYYCNATLLQIPIFLFFPSENNLQF